MNQKVSTTRIFESFGIGEKVISITIIFFFFITLVSFILSLSSYFMTSKNESVLNTSAVLFDYGNKYTYDSCYTCTSGNMMIKNQFTLNNPNLQNTFLSHPITFGNVFFPQVNYGVLPTTWSDDWFNSKIRLAPNSNIVLTGHLKTNSINALQIGYFDYNTNNQTIVCTSSIAQYGSFYFAVDPISSYHYACICVMNPQFPVEACSLMSIPSF